MTSSLSLMMQLSIYLNFMYIYINYLLVLPSSLLLVLLLLLQLLLTEQQQYNIIIFISSPCCYYNFMITIFLFILLLFWRLSLSALIYFNIYLMITDVPPWNQIVVHHYNTCLYICLSRIYNIQIKLWNEWINERASVQLPVQV